MPAPTAKPLPAPGKPIEQKPKLAEALGSRIRLALNKISAASDTGTRNVLDLYYARITTHPRLISDGDSNFPRKPVFHPVNKERLVLKTASPSNLIVAHVGAAILGMYDVATLQNELKDLKAYEARAQEVEPRVYLLEKLAEFGIGSFRIDGNEARGYTLVKIGVKVNPTPQKPSADRKADDIGDPDFDNDAEDGVDED